MKHPFSNKKSQNKIGDDTSKLLQDVKRLTNINCTIPVLHRHTKTDLLSLSSLIHIHKVHFGIPRKKVSILSSFLFLILFSSVGVTGHGDSTMHHDSCLLTSQSTISDSVVLEDPSASSLLHHDNDVYNGGHQDFHYEAHHHSNNNNQTNNIGDEEEESDGTESGMIAGAGSANGSSGKRRVKRSVVHLYDMVVCATGCNPLAYKGYGCYCGFLGSGLTVDGIDRCCAKHDWCYHHAKCPPLLTYFVPYYWTCNNGRPSCVSDYRGWKGICGANMCECDRQFAECLRKFPCPRSRAMCMTSPWRFWQNLLMTPSMRSMSYGYNTHY